MTRFAIIASLSAVSLLPGFSQTQPTPTIRTTASEVLLDIVVRDKHGKTARNLKASDVQIFEDGVRRELKSFRFLSAREAQTRASAPGAGAAETVSPSARTLHAVNLICIVLHNLDPASRPRAIEAVQEFLKNELAPDTFVGLFMLDDS